MKLDKISKCTEYYCYLDVCHEPLWQVWTLKYQLSMHSIPIYICCLLFLFITTTHTNSNIPNDKLVSIKPFICMNIQTHFIFLFQGTQYLLNLMHIVFSGSQI